ncbi:MAG: flagellar type III secretion system pore protein FliP [Firmicutes bacterium]|nr:flagellar type III secretion system pore protein FliP [Bacillota bacterium]
MLVFCAALCAAPAWAQTASVPRITLGVEAGEEPQDLVLSLQILILLTVLALAPSILVLLTCFTRIVIVLSFTRTALGTNQMPPNQVLIGLALFLTLFTMMPTWQQINETALQPYLAGELEFRAAGALAQRPLREFMLQHTRQKDLQLFIDMAGGSPETDYQELGLHVLIPAFVISELKSAFQMGFVLYIPFIVIDMIVSSVLLSLGMMMLPPMMISLPLKVLLFVLADGWHLVVRSLLLSYQ